MNRLQKRGARALDAESKASIVTRRHPAAATTCESRHHLPHLFVDRQAQNRGHIHIRAEVRAGLLRAVDAFSDQDQARDVAWQTVDVDWLLRPCGTASARSTASGTHDRPRTSRSAADTKASNPSAPSRGSRNGFSLTSHPAGHEPMSSSSRAAGAGPDKSHHRASATQPNVDASHVTVQYRADAPPRRIAGYAGVSPGAFLAASE